MPAISSSNVSLSGSIPKEATLQNAAVAIGNGTELDLNASFSSAAFQVIGTFVGTVTFESSNDGGTTWAPLKCYGISGESGSATATAPGIFQTSVASLKKIRARISTYTSGSITVIGTASVVG